MSDTPETDSLALGNHVVPTEFAQGLERQLRKARDYVFRLRKQRAINRNFGEQMERERNHWKRESLEQAKLLAMGGDREEKLRSQLQDAEIRALYEQRLKNTYKKMLKP